MSKRRVKSGLTLVELLIAMALVVAIISMVNAGFFAASKSTESCTGKMTLDWQQLRLIDNIAGQIRCAYAPAQSKDDCFEYSPADNMLHFLTTKQFNPEKDKSTGLLEVDYKFDSAKNALLISEQRFVEASSDTSPQWRQIAENIKDIRLQFFDGRQWLDRWDYTEQNNLPSAVRITVKYQQADLGEQQSSTTAFVCLAGDNRQTVRTEIPREDIIK